MKKSSLEALLLTTAVVAKCKAQTLSPLEIAKAMGKLQKLSTSLNTLYYTVRTYSWAKTEAYEFKISKLEIRAKELAQELEVELIIRRNTDDDIFTLKINGSLYPVR